MRKRNATDLFEDTDNTCMWPPSSESFWTTLFAQFLQSSGRESQGIELTAWQCKPNAPWYEESSVMSKVRFQGLTFESIAVEPCPLSRPWPTNGLVLPANVGGFSPDIVIASAAHITGSAQFAVIENKVTTNACLAENQLINYPQLLEFLKQNGISCVFLLLQSLGAGDDLVRQGKWLQQKLGQQFGILLWEEVFRVMIDCKFLIHGLPISDLVRYSETFDDLRP